MDSATPPPTTPGGANEADAPTARVPRSAYHHGDLRNALLEEASARVTTHGYRAVVGRDVAQAVGVAPSAVYRHFPSQSHLLAAVARKAREALARHLQAAASQVSARDGVARDPVDEALARFDAIGRAYVSFAQASPQLFEVAFANLGAPPDAPDDPSAWQVLTTSLHTLASVGAMDARHLAIAPYVAWTAVHGLAGILGGAVTAGQSGNQFVPRNESCEDGAVPNGQAAANAEVVTVIIDGVLDAVKRSLGLPSR